MDEWSRRTLLGNKLRECREELGLSLDKACKLINRAGQSKKLHRIENPKEDPGGKQRKGGPTLDVLMLEELGRLYGKNLGWFSSLPRGKRLRTRKEVLAAAAADGIRRTRKGHRAVALVSGSYATVGSVFKGMMKREVLTASIENGVTVYKPAPKNKTKP